MWRAFESPARTDTHSAPETAKNSVNSDLASTSISLSDVVEHLSTALLALDDSLNVCFVNAAAEDLLSVSANRAVGEPMSKLFSHPAADNDALRSALAEERSFSQRHAKLTRWDGRLITADYTVTPTRDRCLVVEIQSLDRLLRIDQDRSQVEGAETTKKLLRGLAHEVKNPLGGIRGAAQLLARDPSGDDADDYTRIIIEETDRLVALVDRMLGPSKPHQKTPTNVHRLLERSLRLVQAEARSELQITRDYDPSLPDLYADEDSLMQAFLNIVRNAEQALDGQENAAITVSTRITRQFTIGDTRHRMVAQIDFEDNGPGVPEDIKDRIFFPMISGRAEGTGLGLAISQNIISQHRGTLEVESEPGHTRFSVLLPFGDQS